MLNKKIMILAIFLVSLLAVSAVSAEDNATNEIAVSNDDLILDEEIDDDSLEADESTDSLSESADDFIELYKTDIESADDGIVYVHDSNWKKAVGKVSIFYNNSLAFSRTYNGASGCFVSGKDLVGYFEGECVFNVVYERDADGIVYSKELTPNFINPISNKALTPEDFNVTFPNTEVTVDDGDKVIMTYFIPEGIVDYSSSIKLRYGPGEYDYINFLLYTEDINKTKEFTFANLYIFDTGTFDLQISYYVDVDKIFDIANITLKVTKVYTANDFIEVYTKALSGPTDYVCNVFDSDAGLNGEVTVLANGTSVYNRNFTGNGNTAVRINGNNLTADLKGTYNIKVIYKRSADGKEYSKLATIAFEGSEPVVPDNRPWLYFTPTVDDVEYGQDAVVKIVAHDSFKTQDKTFSGNVLVEILYFNGIEYVTVAKNDVLLKNGAGSATFSNLNVATYLVYLAANDTDEFKASPHSTDLKVSPATINVEGLEDMELDYGSSANITVSAEGATGIIAEIDGGPVTVNGFVIPVSGLSLGEHLLNITPIADSNHIAVANSAIINVVKPKSSIDMNKEIFLVKGKSVNVTVTTKDALGFIAEIDGKNATVDGNVIIISDLDVGVYNLTVTTIVDDNHVAVTEKATITVMEAFSLVVPDVTFNYGTTGTCEISEAFRVVSASVNNNKAIVTFEGNVINISGLDAGTYTLTVKASVQDEEQVKQAKVTVNKVYATIDVEGVELNYGETVNVPVNTTGATGFTAKIDNNDAVVKDGAVVVSGLDVGSHSLKITVIPDSNHIAVIKIVPIMVNSSVVAKLPTSVSASKVTVTYGTSKNVVVVLKDKDNVPIANKKVTVTINGKSYSGTTNDNGQASIAVPKTLAAKTYKSTITFAGDDKYEKSTGTVDVVVAKATPKLTAKSKSFKRSVKTKIYAVTLKTNLNKVMKSAKVTIKVNKKTYTVKTNSKGVATFKLTKLTKKGKYTATVKYAGSSNYKAKSVNVKITIK